MRHEVGYEYRDAIAQRSALWAMNQEAKTLKWPYAFMSDATVTRTRPHKFENVFTQRLAVDAKGNINTKSQYQNSRAKKDLLKTWQKSTMPFNPKRGQFNAA
jgi:hypothetical protein